MTADEFRALPAPVQDALLAAGLPILDVAEVKLSGGPSPLDLRVYVRMKPIQQHVAIEVVYAD